MKINKLLFSLVALFVLMSACEKEFLERLPLDQISSSDYWKTTNDLELYVNQFYPSFSDGGAWSGGIYWFDDNSDNMIYRTYNSRLAGLRTVPSGGGWSYSAIRSVNTFFANYKNCTEPYEKYKQFSGEAHFFRAYYYFSLVRTYGDVPWVDVPLTPGSEELYAPQTPRNEVVNHIIADLDTAIVEMQSGPNLNGMRLNKEIAQLLKARVCLYEGTWEKYHAGSPFGVSGSDGSSYLQQAAQVAEDLINDAPYSIFSTGDPKNDYWHLFNPYDYTGNPEVMLWKKYDANLGRTHNHQRYLPRIGGGRGITKALADAYLCTDGLPISLSPLFQGYDSLAVEKLNRDPRFTQLIYNRGDPKGIVGTDTTERFTVAMIDASGESICPSGYQLFKGALPDPDQYYSSWVGTNPSPIFRFGEALLIFAEAKAELGTLTQGDVDISINVLRDRVGMAHMNLAGIQTDPNWEFPTLSPIINEVRRERRVELACEGYRWNDIARWAAADELVVGKRFKGAKFVPEYYPTLVVGESVFIDDDGFIDWYQNTLPGGYGFDIGRDYLSPISTEQLTLNENLVQNPGWE